MPARRPNRPICKRPTLAFLDIDGLFFALERFKAERGWHNLNLSRAGIRALLADTPPGTACSSPNPRSPPTPSTKSASGRRSRSHCSRSTRSATTPSASESGSFRTSNTGRLTEDDPNFPMVREEGGEYGYRILVEKSRQDIVAKLEELKAAIEGGDLKPWTFRGLSAVWFDKHLYQPLLALEGGVVEVSPVPLNRGERRFVEDLKAYCDGNAAAFEDRELYLLRNRSRGRGIGFFEAGNFHPDFILWLLAGDRQHVTFVDPKGIRNVGADDPKIRFFETVKEIERRLGDPRVALDSFIVSNTPSHVMKKLWGIDKPRDGGTAHRIPGRRPGFVHRCDTARHRGRTGREGRAVMATYSAHARHRKRTGREEVGGSGGVLRCRARSADVGSRIRSRGTQGVGRRRHEDPTQRLRLRQRSAGKRQAGGGAGRGTGRRFLRLVADSTTPC